VYGGRYSTEVRETYILKSAKFTGLVPNAEYAVLALAKLETSDLLANDNLLAIGQVTADSSGAATFQFVPKLDSSECYVIACGASNRNLAYASISLMEMQAGDTPRAVEPIVTYEGKELVEGRDYELLGQVDYTQAGEYTCYIRGINNYTGLVECTYQVEAAIEKFNIAFANMTLGNSLAMNFAFRQDACEDWSGAYAKIVKTYADGRANKEITIPYAQWGSAGINGVKHFTLKFDGVAAKEMSDSVYVTIYDAKGNAISNTWEDSVRGYAMRTLNNPKTSEESAIMVVDLLNYGAAAQEYFKYNQADLANNQMTAAQKALATKDAPAADGRIKGPNYRGTNLGLESQILMRMAFAQAPADAYATIEFTNHSGRDVKVNIPSEEILVDKGSSIIVIDDIVLADGRKPVTVTIYNADGSAFASATDSMEGYIARMREKAEDPLYEAILKFSDSAYNFFH